MISDILVFASLAYLLLSAGLIMRDRDYMVISLIDLLVSLACSFYTLYLAWSMI